MSTEYSVILTADGTQYTFYPQSCVFTRPLCSRSLRHEEQSVSVVLPYEPTLLSLFVANEQLPAVIKCGGTTVFTGVITVDLDWDDAGEIEEIESFNAKIKDNTYLLDASSSNEIAITNTTVGAVIQSLCSARGVAVASGAALPSDVIEIFQADSGSNYKTLLDDLCYQYKNIFLFDDNGQLTLFDFAAVPSAPDYLDDSDLSIKVSIQKSKRDYTGVKIGYNTITKKDNELVYFSGNGYKSDGTVQPYVIQPDVYFPFDSDPALEETNGQIYQSYESGYAQTLVKLNGEQKYQRSSGTTLLHTENQYLVNDWDSGTLFANRTEFGSKQSSVRLLNTGSTDVNLYSLSIRATAWYRETDASVSAGGTDNPFEYDAKYIYTAAAAETLAKLLTRYLCIGQYQLQTQTETKIPLGTFRIIDTGATGYSVKALAISYSHDPDKGYYTTTWISVSDAKVTTHKSIYKGSSTKDATAQSISWQGSFDTAPLFPQKNWAYFNTADRCSYIYTGSEWQIMSTSGADAAGYTCVLENNTKTYSADSDGNITFSQITATVRAYKGDKAVPVRVSNIDTPAGFLITRRDTVLTIAALDGAAMADEGQIAIPVKLVIPLSGTVYGSGSSVIGSSDGSVYGEYINSDAAPTFVLYFTWSKTRSGAAGPDGDDGATGAESPSYNLVNTSPVIKKLSDGTFDPAQIILQGKQSTASGGVTSYDCRFKIFINGSASAAYTSNTDEAEVNFTIQSGTTSAMCRMYKAGSTFSELDNQYIPVISDGYAYTVLLKDTHQTYQSDDNGRVLFHRLVTEIVAYRGLSAIDVDIGSLPSVPGFSLSKRGKVLTIDALDGTSMASSGNIEIPVTVGTVESGTVYGSGSFIYGSGSQVYGKVSLAADAQTFKVYFSYEKSILSNTVIAPAIPKYKGTVSSDTAFPSNVNYGDWVVYTGTTTTTYTKGYCYYWTGANWAKDTDASHEISTLTDMLTLLDTLSDDDAPAIKFVKRLCVSEFFVNRIIGNSAFITSLFANEIQVGNRLFAENDEGTQTVEITHDGLLSAKSASFTDCTLGGLLYQGVPVYFDSHCILKYNTGTLSFTSTKNGYTCTRASTGIYAIHYTKPSIATAYMATMAIFHGISSSTTSGAPPYLFGFGSGGGPTGIQLRFADSSGNDADPTYASFTIVWMLNTPVS
jgi:hypothetical protein